MDKKKKIIDIVPLTRLPLTRNQSFSYLWNEKIDPGTLVSIPLFKRNVEGIVINSRNDFERLGNIQLKKVDKIIEEKFLDEKQLELAGFISEYYISPLGIVLKNFVPKRVNQRKMQIAESETHNLKKNIILTKEQKSAIAEITKNPASYKLQANSYLLFGPSGSGKTEVYIRAIKNLPKNQQALILLPEITLTPQAIERYGEHFKEEEIAVINSRISKGKLYDYWKRIKSGEIKIIIGSRMAVFLPFKKLGLIVIDEEQDMSFKQWDMNPRYDARTVAEKMAKIHQSKIVFGSATPSLESYFKASNKDYKLLRINRFNKDTDIELVDLKKERWQKNYSTISKQLRSEIAYALKNGLQTILFINKQGLSNFSICESCKTVLKCPRCDRALIYDNSGIYKCIHCSYKTSITPSCYKCQGIIFKNIGIGTQKVEKEVSDIFPSARILRVDQQTTRNPKSQEEIYQKFKNKEAGILIGTQMISKGWDLPNVALVGIIDADSMLTTPDFSSKIRAFQIIMQVSGRAGRPGAKFPGKIIIQTFNPEQKFFKTIREKNIEDFYKEELNERKELKLPPFGKIIKLVFQDKSLKRTEAETERIYKNISQEKNIQISEPQDSFTSKIRGRFRKQMIIKFKNNPPERLLSILKGLPAGWIIDVDPISTT